MKNLTTCKQYSGGVFCFFFKFLTQWTKSYLLLNLNDLYVLHQNISNVQAVVEKKQKLFDRTSFGFRHQMLSYTVV